MMLGDVLCRAVVASTLRVVGPPVRQVRNYYTQAVELAIACMCYSRLIDVIADRSCEQVDRQ